MTDVAVYNAVWYGQRHILAENLPPQYYFAVWSQFVFCFQTTTMLYLLHVVGFMYWWFYVGW
jgi:hypothetical protein